MLSDDRANREKAAATGIKSISSEFPMRIQNDHIIFINIAHVSSSRLRRRNQRCS